MEHILDNPAWNALISGNAHLSFGDGRVRYFDKEVSPFAAFNENTSANFSLLAELLPDSRPALFVSRVETDIPAPWKVLRTIRGFQMVHHQLNNTQAIQTELIRLTHEHVPQMIALTKLTNPGPFALRTIEFGHYYGVFGDDKLVAMAGQRLHAFNYAEISAVCTHPAYTGKGYARQLLNRQVQRITAASEIPFLHVRYDNDRAIQLYESLGFYKRREVYFYFMVKEKATGFFTV